MDWLRENLFFLIFFILFIAMHPSATACTEAMAGTGKKMNTRGMVKGRAGKR